MSGSKGSFAKLSFVAGCLSLLAGCASVTQGTEQSVKIETMSKEGKAIEGAECKLSNDKGSAVVTSGQSANVRRSGGNLTMQCAMAGQPDATGQAVSRANAALAGNIILGGGIGAAIDVGTGAAYTYPTWMQLVFGEDRVYDRSGNRHDGPVAGEMVRDTAPVAAKQPNGTPTEPSEAAATTSAQDGKPSPASPAIPEKQAGST